MLLINHKCKFRYLGVLRRIMDVLKETGNATRHLIARHISADKALPESNYAINSTLICHTYSNNPDFASYYSALHPYIWAFWTIGLVILIALWIIYFVALQSARRHWKEYLSYVAFILSIYPLVATVSFISMIMPRFRLPAEAIAQQIVTLALYNFFELVIAECGGVDQIVRRLGGTNLETRTLPCCCWPCCVIPRPNISQKSLAGLRYLVLQVPIIQAIIFVIILALWVEDYDLYNSNFIFFQPFVAASIIPGMWGVVMSVRMAMSMGLNLKKRLLSIQLALIIVKVQIGLAKSLPDLINGSCLVKLHPVVFASLIQNTIMLVEMCLISLWAWRLYSVPPGKDLEIMSNERPTSALDDNVRSIEVKSAKEGVDNETFNNNVNTDE